MSEDFSLQIDADLFRSTNGAWNYLMLNDPWSVGYVTSLIEVRQWSSKEEWEQYYFASGTERKLKSGERFKEIENFQLVRTNKRAIYNLPWSLKNLNYQYGRTKEDLMRRAKALLSFMKEQGSPITLEQCYECVRYRTICETWNGVIIREHNTIKVLQPMFSNTVSFKKTDSEIDHQYAVDYEVYMNGLLKFGIQIKPKSYFGKAPYLERARYANEQKFAAYQERYDVPVYIVTSKTNGEIQNPEVITSMQKALS